MSWLPPYNGGSPISEYKIQFRHKYDPEAGIEPVFSELDDCLGNTYSILIQRYCDVSMTIFKEAPLSLEYQDLIVVRISSFNQIGESNFSNINTHGISVQTEPLAPTTLLTVIGYDEQSI